MKHAFTLIELLIVVAIIAILAAIAVPNFLEAQTRAKVSRAQNDMRSLATAIESYTVDNNKPPSAWLPNGNVSGRSVFYPDVALAVSPRFIRLTTPVAYMTSVLRDPFVISKNLQTAGGGSTNEYDTYDYIDAMSFSAEKDTSAKRGASITSGAGWRLASAGPDGMQYYGGGYVGFGSTNAYGVDYDPTNGTKSVGDLVRVGGGPGIIYQKIPAIDRVQNKINGLN